MASASLSLKAQPVVCGAASSSDFLPVIRLHFQPLPPLLWLPCLFGNPGTFQAHAGPSSARDCPSAWHTLS